MTKQKHQTAQQSSEQIKEKGDKIQFRDIDKSKGIAIGNRAIAIVLENISILNLTEVILFVRQHWRLLVMSLLMQALVLIIWSRYANRFLLLGWRLIVGMSLLEVGLIACYNLERQKELRRLLGVILTLSSLAFITLIASEYWRVIYPIPFETDDFGVAVAHFGEGPDFHNTSDAREISKLVLKRLEQQAVENPDLQFVQFKPIGLVQNQSEALADGNRIKADLVIWGQLQVSESATTLHFTILETPDKISNPTFPRIVPIVEQAATGVIEIPHRSSETIAGQMTQISNFTFGLAHFFKWDFASAAIAFKEALQTAAAQPGSYLLHFYYGLSLQWPGDLEEAAEQLKIAASLNPEDPAAPLGLAFGFKSLGKVEEFQAQAHLAVELSERRLKLRPEDDLAYYTRGLAEEALDDWENALSSYRGAIEHNPNLYVARLNEVRMLIALKRLSEAVQVGQETVEYAKSQGANPAWAYLYLAEAYRLSSDPAQAHIAYQEAITLAPHVDWIHFLAAKFYESEEDLSAAQNEYEAMVSVSSNAVWGHSELGDFFARHDRLEEAIVEYQLVLRINRGLSATWAKLADVYNRLESTEEARKAYTRAITVEPENYYAWVAYGNFLYSQGNLTAAIEQWSTANVINPTDCNLLLNMGAAYTALGATVDAQAVYSKALTLPVGSGSNCHTIAQEHLERLLP